MTDQEKVNSNPYWDNRFGTDWEISGGREQSRFFSQVAIETMPKWLVDLVRLKKLTVCDWGCAEGDGTEALAKAFGWDITGIDFSSSAIERARQLYGNIKFSHENLLHAPSRPVFDVVFSSNTLEHFSDPWAIFDKVSAFASKYLVLLIPYREFPRHEEHEVTFDNSNIPISPNADWTLVHCAVEDTRAKEPNYWRGEQILLVFARASELATQRLTLADITRFDIDPDADGSVARLRAEKTALETRAATAEANFERAKTVARAHQERIRADQERIHFLEYREKELVMQVQGLLGSTSWRVTAPLRAMRACPRWLKQRLRDVKIACLRVSPHRACFARTRYRVEDRWTDRHPPSSRTSCARRCLPVRHHRLAFQNSETATSCSRVRARGASRVLLHEPLRGFERGRLFGRALG
jgi:hypothetical protein